VLVNVSRGKVIDSDALLARLARGDVIACLDVFDPEPIPLDSPVLDCPTSSSRRTSPATPRRAGGASSR
jgi:phosphoglycerate dehydrogenase-like enzyme